MSKIFQNARIVEVAIENTDGGKILILTIETDCPFHLCSFVRLALDEATVQQVDIPMGNGTELSDTIEKLL